MQWRSVSGSAAPELGASVIGVIRYRSRARCGSRKYFRPSRVATYRTCFTRYALRTRKSRGALRMCYVAFWVFIYAARRLDRERLERERLIRRIKAPAIAACCTMSNYAGWNGTNEVAECQMSRTWRTGKRGGETLMRTHLGDKSLMSRTRSRESLPRRARTLPAKPLGAFRELPLF